MNLPYRNQELRKNGIIEAIREKEYFYDYTKKYFF